MELLPFDEFVDRIARAVPVESVLQNPGGGTTTVLSYSDNVLRYKRGGSSFKVALRSLYEAFQAFRGRRLTSAKLAKFAPRTFDSRSPHNGHSCNCTTLYLLLREAGFVDQIRGAGVRGNPFYVDIPK